MMSSLLLHSSLVVIVFFLVIPLHQARPLGVGVYEENFHLSLLPSTAKETSDELVAPPGYTEPENGGESAVALGFPLPADGALHRRPGRSPPAPKPHTPTRPGVGDGEGGPAPGPGGVAGKRRPPAPPPPAGCKPPHWCRPSEEPAGPRQPRARDVVLRVLRRVIRQSSASAVEIAEIARRVWY
ncbi:hypothetical protein ACP70R_011501 [Stipagrostis hirtigluma subsp. patula]